MKEVAIVIGHTQLRPGACSKHGLPCEHKFNKEVTTYLEDICDTYEYDSYNFGYTSMVKRLAKKINKKKYKLVIELHYNAASSEKANGTEVLYYFNNYSARSLAKKFCRKFCEKFKTKNRGAKSLYKKSQRGFAAVYYPKPTVLLLEPFFGSSESDCNKVKGKEKEYAQLLREFLIENIIGK